MLKNQPYLRLLLSFVATGIFILAAYFVAAYFIDSFFTTYRWQIKALAIYNLIGGTQESWWTEKATSIAWDLLLNNQGIMSWLWTAVVSGLARVILLGKGN
jgi:hypothetical protein